MVDNASPVVAVASSPSPVGEGDPCPPCKEAPPCPDSAADTPLVSFRGEAAPSLEEDPSPSWEEGALPPVEPQGLVRTSGAWPGPPLLTAARCPKQHPQLQQPVVALMELKCQQHPPLISPLPLRWGIEVLRKGGLLLGREEAHWASCDREGACL